MADACITNIDKWCSLADLAVTPRKAAGDEHVSSSRSGRNAPKSTSTGSMMGLVRAAAAVRRSKKDGLVRRSADHRGEFGSGVRVSADHRGEFGPGIRVSAGSKPDLID